MGTKIEWAEETWNPLTGCSKISPGCDNCYAERNANRLRGRVGYDADEPFKITWHPKRLEKPLRFKKSKIIFVGSMGDIFHENVKVKHVVEIFKTAEKAPWHKYLFLTKRPKNMLYAFNRYGRIPENFWLGVTAENQEMHDLRVPILKKLDAKVKFVSVEPMLEPVRIDQELDWIICGGETGAKARKLETWWVQGLVNECLRYGIPFMFKSWGVYTCMDGEYVNVGKKKSGREIDGETWDQYPKP